MIGGWGVFWRAKQDLECCEDINTRKEVRESPKPTRALERVVQFCALLLFTLTLSSELQAQASEAITWDALVPELLAEEVERTAVDGQASDAPLNGKSSVLPYANAFDPLSAGTVVVEEWGDGAFQVASELLGAMVTIDGYVLPLTSAEGRVVEFLLVPWVGACIHTPVPPPNQIIHVSYPSGLALEQDFDAVRLTGTLVSEPADHRLFLVDGQRDIPVSYALVDAAKAGPPGKVVASSVNDIPLVARAQIWISTLFTDSMTAFGKEGSLTALLFALLISFGYGALHTLGPGHGKAVVVSYFVGSGGSLSRGLSMGVRIAVFHVLSAVLVVFLLDFAVRKTTGAAPSDYRAIRLGSYALICAIGAVMLWQALAAIRMRKGAAASGAHDHSHDHTHDHHGQSGCAACSTASAQKGIGWIAAAVGVVPCTGALLVMLFGLANDLVLPAIAMVVAISAGMAVAMSAIGITALWGRGWAERRLGTNEARRARVETGARLAGASFVLLIGLLLFWTTYTQEQTLAVPEITLAERSEFPSD